MSVTITSGQLVIDSQADAHCLPDPDLKSNCVQLSVFFCKGLEALHKLLTILHGNLSR